MSKGMKLAIAFAVVVVLVGGAVVVTSLTGEKKTTTSTNPADDLEVAATITYTEDGFSPLSLSVPAGSYIRVINQSDSMVGPSSDDHPTHRKNTELNFRDAAPGEGVVAQVITKGEWVIHNHYKDGHKATITVE